MTEIVLSQAGGGGTGGTVTANQGTPNTPANSWPVEITDGTNVLGTAAHPVNVASVVAAIADANNSSTTPLTAGSTFTGTGTSLLPYASVIVLVDSDQASAASGLQIQFSTDSTNWIDSSSFTYTVGSGVNEGQSYGSAARGQFYRVVYTNGGTNQARFRLQTVIRPGTVTGDMIPANVPPNTTQHGQLVIANITGQTTGGGGGFVNVKVNPSGTLPVDASGTTVPVSQGTAAAASGSWPVEVTDGTNVLGVSAHPLRVDPTGTTAQPVTVNAGTNLIGQVSASGETSTVYNGTTALTPSFATLTTSSSGDNTVVSAVAAHRIRVLSVKAMTNASVNIFFRDGTAGTQIDGTGYMTAGGGYVLPYSPVGWFQTTSGNALVINLSGAVLVGLTVVYVAV